MSIGLIILQRSPHWVVPNPNYFVEVADGKKWVLANVPFSRRWYRFQLFWAFADGLHPALKIDPEWHDGGRIRSTQTKRVTACSWNATAARAGRAMTPLLAKVMPGYPPYGKRILIDNDWFEMLKRPNVDLVTDPIASIVPEGVVTADGKV